MTSSDRRSKPAPDRVRPTASTAPRRWLGCHGGSPAVAARSAAAPTAVAAAASAPTDLSPRLQRQNQLASAVAVASPVAAAITGDLHIAIVHPFTGKYAGVGAAAIEGASAAALAINDGPADSWAAVIGRSGGHRGRSGRCGAGAEQRAERQQAGRCSRSGRAGDRRTPADPRSQQDAIHAAGRQYRLRYHRRRLPVARQPVRFATGRGHGAVRRQEGLQEGRADVLDDRVSPDPEGADHVDLHAPGRHDRRRRQPVTWSVLVSLGGAEGDECRARRDLQSDGAKHRRATLFQLQRAWGAEYSDRRKRHHRRQ